MATAYTAYRATDTTLGMCGITQEVTYKDIRLDEISHHSEVKSSEIIVMYKMISTALKLEHV